MFILNIQTQVFAEVFDGPEDLKNSYLLFFIILGIPVLGLAFIGALISIIAEKSPPFKQRVLEVFFTLLCIGIVYALLYSFFFYILINKALLK